MSTTNNATNNSAASDAESLIALARQALEKYSQRSAGAVAVAQPNIALVKYWGKRDSGLNLPAVSSLSVTLDSLYTVTKVSRSSTAATDVFHLDGHALNAQKTTHLSILVERFRQHAKSKDRVVVHSHNNFPTAAGLASSASGYAAMVTALDDIFETKLAKTQLSELARLGSGSAARSIFGGFAIMDKGQIADGSDAVAYELAGTEHWPLEVLVAITSEQTKTVSSTEGMEKTRATSAFWPAWLQTQDHDMHEAREAVMAKDFARLADVTERSCLKMHGLMISSGLLYWNPATLACIHALRALRATGVEVCYTVDAGPQVKAICAPGQAREVEAKLSAVPGVLRVLRTGLGSGARVLSS